jgi:hypothetical protein
MNISKNKPVALTVLMAPRVCSTTFAASPYFACMRLESLALNIDTHAKAIATGGMLESITRARYPSSYKCYSEATNTSRKELYGLPNLMSIKPKKDLIENEVLFVYIQSIFYTQNEHMFIL